MEVEHLSNAHDASRPEKPSVRATARTVMLAEIPNKQVLDTSVWNNLIDDPGLDLIRERLCSVTIIPTALAIAEIAATEDRARRLGLLRLIKTVGKDNRPLATPNQLIIAVCQGYARGDQTLTLNTGNDAEGAWIALDRPELADDAAQRVALEFNREREDVFRNFTEGLREKLKVVFENEERPPSMGALLRHYMQNDDFLYEVVNPIYKRAVGVPLVRYEFLSLLNSTPYWRMFLLGYGCAIYQRAVKRQGFGHRKNPGHLDLWSATYLPSCDVFVTADKRQRRALKILNKGNARPASIMSYGEWREALFR